MVSAKLLSVEETSEQLGVKIPTLRSWIQQRRVPYIKLGRRVLFDPEDVEQLKRENRVEAVRTNGR